MMKWCAYCQSYVGEVEPYDDLSLTHGMCIPCGVRGFNLSDEETDSLLILKKFHQRIYNAGRLMSNDVASAIIAEAIKAKLRRVDVLIGLLAPLLYQIGEQWANKKITVADEHNFTKFSKEVLRQITEINHFSNPAEDINENVQVLLVNAEGNCHTLGIQMIELCLGDAGLSARAVYPGVAPCEMPRLTNRMRPRLLGISISLAEQIPGVVRSIAAIRATPELTNLPILLSGFAVKQGKVPPIAGAKLIADFSSLDGFIATVKKLVNSD